MMALNKEKLELLIYYLKILGSLNGNYHREINNAIEEIEKEFEIRKDDLNKKFISFGIKPVKVNNSKFRSRH